MESDQSASTEAGISFFFEQHEKAEWSLSSAVYASVLPFSLFSLKNRTIHTELYLQRMRYYLYTFYLTDNSKKKA